jgi:ERCC4-related helicase/ERCC4-type nuclease
MQEYVDLKLIAPKSIEARAYQVILAESAVKASTMIVLPTGLGKTVIALLAIAKRLENGGRVIFLAPTKPLVEQHAEFLRSHLLADTTIFTGEIPPEQRSEQWKKKHQAIVSTPQVIENDVKAGRITLDDVKLIVFDEAHRAVGNYAYRYIASKYVEQAIDPLILGMTASPGGTVEKIKQVSESLFIEKIEIRTESDPDVYPYTHQKNIEVRRFELPPQMEAIRRLLKEAASKKVRQLIQMRVVLNEWVSTSELIKIQNKVASDKHFRAMTLVAEVIKLRHAIGLIETQGVVPTRKYFERLKKEAESKKGSKAARNLVANDRVKSAMQLASRLDEAHPKLGALRDVAKEQLAYKPDSRIIVFTNYRDTAEIVKKTLNTLQGVRAEKFVGQAKKDGLKGLSQKEQVQLISDFVNGTFNVIVATSVAEEGLDIPATDMVVFYEPIPSEIRSIQREGRTGRRRAGRVVVLITKGTRDEAYSSSSTRKKRMMSAEIKRLSATQSSAAALVESRSAARADPVLLAGVGATPEQARLETKCSFHPTESSPKTAKMKAYSNGSRGTVDRNILERQRTLLDFNGQERMASQNRIHVVADLRESKSGVLEELEALGALVERETLPVADYVISDRVAVERKTDSDFVASMTERDLFSQIQQLAINYERPLIIVEGLDLYTQRGVHPKSVRGMLAAITIDLGVPTLCSRDACDTARLLFALAEREQTSRKRTPAVHGKKVKKTLREQQEYVICAIPSIGLVTARSLLGRFGSLEALFQASTPELTKVPGIGPRTAAIIHKLATAYYETADRQPSNSKWTDT